MLNKKLSSLFWLFEDRLAGDEDLVCSGSPYLNVLGDVGVSNKNPIPGLVYVQLRAFPNQDMGTGSATENADMFNVLPYVCSGFFGDDD